MATFTFIFGIVGLFTTLRDETDWAALYTESY